MELGEDGRFRYQARAGFSGTDTFRYTAAGSSDTAHGAVTVTVPRPDRAPVTGTRPGTKPTGHRHPTHPSGPSAPPATSSARAGTGLANTGTATAWLMGLGLLLIPAGAVLTRRFAR